MLGCCSSIRVASALIVRALPACRSTPPRNFTIEAPEADRLDNPKCDLDPEQHRGFSPSGITPRSARCGGSYPANTTNPRGFLCVTNRATMATCSQRHQFRPSSSSAAARRGPGWFCERCLYRKPAAFTPVIIRWGPDASSDILRRSARCDATLREGRCEMTVLLCCPSLGVTRRSVSFLKQPIER